ncbi:MAG TPA: hemolysin family protein, partial [bacterium]|nr:hemolysin family protein [bacterium]
MDYNLFSHLVVLAALLLVSMFFSAVETSLLSAPRGLIESNAERPGLLGRAFREWSEHPNRILTTVLIGTNSVNVITTLLAAYTSIHLAEVHQWNPVITGTVTSVFVTFVIIVFGEMIPKITARSLASRVVVWLILPIYLIDRLIRPFTTVLARVITFFIPALSDVSVTQVTEEDIKHMIEVGRQDGTIREDEQDMIHSVFKFSDTTVNQVMIPRTRMFCVDVKTGLEPLLDTIIQKGYSRVPVYKGDVDNIVGVLHTRDLLSIWRNQGLIVVQDLLRKPYFVPETMRVDRLLREFRRGKIHMAIVVDEYGGTSGLVTLEDLVEQIVGEIRDEHEPEDEKSIVKQEDGSYHIEAGTPLDEINEVLGLHLTPKGEITTLSGYLTELNGRVPKKGRVLDEYEATTTILESSEKKVIRVKLVKKDVPYPP